MKKVISVLTVVILAISCTVVNAAAEKVSIKDKHLLFDVWQGIGEVSVCIEEDVISGVTVKPSQFESLKINGKKLNDADFYITDCDSSTVITLKESYLKTLEDGCYYSEADFETAVIPVNLYVVTEVFKVADLCYSFTPWFDTGNATAVLDSNYSLVPIWLDLFESLSFNGKEVSSENYSVSSLTNIPVVMLYEDYLKSFEPGEYYFSADFVNIKDVMIKIKIYGNNIPGDVDGNGKISANDARITLRASVKLENLTSEQQMLADIDNNNRITATDARALLRISVGL